MNNKPISIVLDDLKNDLANVINEASLPPCLIEPILKDLYTEAANASKYQLEKDKKDYAEKLASEEKESEETIE